MNVTVIARNRRVRAGSVTARPLCVMLNIPPETANYVADRPVRKMKIRKARIVAAIILSISLRSFSARFSLVYSNTCARLVRERRHSIIRRVRLLSFGLATTPCRRFLPAAVATHTGRPRSPTAAGRQLVRVGMITCGCSLSGGYFAPASSSSSVSIGSGLCGAAISRTAFSISAATSAFSFKDRFEFSRPCPNRVSP